MECIAQGKKFSSALQSQNHDNFQTQEFLVLHPYFIFYNCVNPDTYIAVHWQELNGGVGVWHIAIVLLNGCRDVSGEEEDYRDLKATIAEREKHGTRTDSYITYKIVTEVSFVTPLTSVND